MTKNRFLISLLFVNILIWLTSCEKYSPSIATSNSSVTLTSTYNRTYTIIPTNTIIPTQTTTPLITNTRQPTFTHTKVSMGEPNWFSCFTGDNPSYVNFTIQFPKGWEKRESITGRIIWGPPRDNRSVKIHCRIFTQDAKTIAEAFLPSRRVLQYEGQILINSNYDAYKMTYLIPLQDNRKELNLIYVIRRENKHVIILSATPTSLPQSEWEGFLDAIVYTIIINQ
jgi:hypothetical protein